MYYMDVGVVNTALASLRLFTIMTSLKKHVCMCSHRQTDRPPHCLKRAEERSDTLELWL